MKKQLFAFGRYRRANQSEQHKNTIPHRFMVYGIVGLAFVGLAGSLLTNNVEAFNNVVGETVFNGVGRYDYAFAGNNNVDRGNSYDDNLTTSKLITPEQNSNLPSNWTQIRQKIEAEGYSVTNLSGSRLDMKGGKAKLALLRGFNCAREQGVDFIYLIGPDGNYKKVNYFEDITEYVNSQSNPSGWYFVFYPQLDASTCNQASWGIASIYESSNLGLSHVETVATENNFIAGSGYDPDVTTTTEDVLFSTPYKAKNNTELIGLYLLAGARSWPVAGKTEDETYMIINNNGTIMQLSQDLQYKYNGKLAFAGRSDTDFAVGLFRDVVGSANVSHNIIGGEVDIFDEMINSDFLNEGEKIYGYEIRKSGTNILSPTLFGIRQDVDEPKLQVEPYIPADNPTHPVVTLENISDHTACAVKMTIPLSSIGNPTNVEIDPSTGVTSKVADGNLIVEAPSLSGSVKINLTLTVPEQDSASLNIHPVVNYYASIDGACPEVAYGEDSTPLMTEGVDTVYRVMTEYVDENGNTIADSTYSYAHTGDEYTTEAKEIAGYTLTVTPANHAGTVAEESILVSYVYKLTASAPDTGLFTNSGNYLVPVSISVAGLVGAGLAVWFTRRKLTSKHIDFKK